jgi:undecaprenyl-diphosphatase
MKTKLGKLTKPLFEDYYYVWPLLAAVLFVLIAVLLPHMKPVDSAITSTIKLLPHSLKIVMEGFSALASVQATIGIVVAWFLFLIAFKRWKFALTMAGALTAMPLFGLLKLMVKRSRPDPAIMVAFGFHNDSFPSGHATASAIVYLTIAYLAQKSLSTTWARIVSGIAVFLTVAVGVSRIYLGFHFPTDVIAGWLVAIFVFLIVKRMADGHIESDTKKKSA